MELPGSYPDQDHREGGGTTKTGRYILHSIASRILLESMAYKLHSDISMLFSEVKKRKENDISGGEGDNKPLLSEGYDPSYILRFIIIKAFLDHHTSYKIIWINSSLILTGIIYFFI